MAVLVGNDVGDWAAFANGQMKGLVDRWAGARFYARMKNRSRLSGYLNRGAVFFICTMVKVWIGKIVAAFIPLAMNCGIASARRFPNGFVRAIEHQCQKIVVRHVTPENRRPDRERANLTAID